MPIGDCKDIWSIYIAATCYQPNKKSQQLSDLSEKMDLSVMKSSK